jgi:Rieske Fe-S protein
MAGPELGRRDVLRGGALVFATVAVSGCAALFGSTRDADLTVVPQNGEFRIPAARGAEVIAGLATLAVAVEGRVSKVLLFRGPDGAVAALDMRCTHKGCDVAWDVEHERIACPCHGSKFAATGDVLEGPAERPLRAHAARVDGGEIVVAVG